MMSHCQEEQHVLRTVKNVEPTTSSQVAEAAPTRPAATEDDEFTKRGDGSGRSQFSDCLQATISTQRFPNHSKGEQDDDRRRDDDESDDVTAVLKMMGTRHIHCITRDDSEENE